MELINEKHPVIYQLRSGKMGDEYEHYTLPLKIIHGAVVLPEFPDKNYKVVINGYSEVSNYTHSGELQVDNYYVDYTNGTVYFHPSQSGETVNVEFYGKGMTYFPAERVYTRLDSGNIAETLSEVIDTAREGLEHLPEILSVIADAEQATNNANQAANGINDALERIDEAVDGLDEAELLRNNAENSRNQNEGIRESQEDTRELNEGARASAENQRLSNETTRQSQEITRQQAESLRVLAESERETAESIRNNTFTSKISQIDNAIQETVSAINETEDLRDSFTFINSPYSDSVMYYKNNLIHYNGNSYICVQDSIGNAPTDTDYWRLFASKGQNGEGAISEVVSTNGDIIVQGSLDTPDLSISSKFVKKDANGNISVNGISVTNTAMVANLNAERLDGVTKEEIFGAIGDVQDALDNIDLSNKANINSPNFTGVPTTPTPTVIDNTTRVANTAFVQSVVGEKVDNFINTHTTNTDIHITSTERNNWNNKETPEGAQVKATAAKNEAISAAEVDATSKADAVQTNLNSHINDTDIHVTESQKTFWNSKANGNDLQIHVTNENMHVTSIKEETWNAKADKSDIDNANKFVLTTGTNIAYAVTIPTALTGYTRGMRVSIELHEDAGTTPTINVNGWGAKAADVKKAGFYILAYNGTSFQSVSGKGGEGEASLNVFTGLNAPETPKGIWIESDISVNSVTTDTSWYTGGTWDLNDNGAHYIDSDSSGDGRLGTNTGRVSLGGYLYFAPIASGGLFFNITRYDFKRNRRENFTYWSRAYSNSNYTMLGTDGQYLYAFELFASSTSSVQMTVTRVDVEKKTSTTIGVMSDFGIKNTKPSFYNGKFYFIGGTAGTGTTYQKVVVTFDINTRVFSRFNYSGGGTPSGAFTTSEIINGVAYVFNTVGMSATIKMPISNGSPYVATYVSSENGVNMIGGLEGSFLLGNTIYLNYYTNAPVITQVPIINTDSNAVSYINLQTTGVGGTYVNIVGHYDGNIVLFMRNHTTSPSSYTYRLEDKVYDEGTIIIGRTSNNNGTYSTELLSPSEGSLLGSFTRIETGFNDVAYHDGERLLTNLPTYYGNGSSWIKFKG